MRVVFVQHGDFRAADRRIREGIGATYDAQEYSMNVVKQLAKQASLAAVICVDAEEPHDEILVSRVRSIGLESIWQHKRPFDGIISRLEELAPTHLILSLPSSELLVWARKRNVRVLPCFADTFPLRPGLRSWIDRWRRFRLARALNHPSVDFIGNHNIAAAEALAEIGVNPEKVVPWDWPRSPTPKDFPIKMAPNVGRKRLIFVGTVSEAKGVGDILRALAADPGMGEGATLEVLGAGDIEGMRLIATQLGVDDRVSFSGRVPHAAVAPAMHAADAVLVYSRKTYGEGLPGTIYLGLASRTPVVVSDHPMFTAYFRDGNDVLVVPERNPDALAAKLTKLFSDDLLYQSLSRNSLDAFNRIVHPVLWGEFIERWLRNGGEDRDWLNAQALPKWRSKQK